MGMVALLVGALVVVALMMYWIFSATARHTELRAQMLNEPAGSAMRRARRS
jgi:hypothetical protein